MEFKVNGSIIVLKLKEVLGLLDLSDELPDKDGILGRIVINEWICDFEIFSFESTSLIQITQLKEMI